MANDWDKNWFVDLNVGQMTGMGSGPYGEIGNQQYRQQQRQKAEEARIRARAAAEAAAARKAQRAEEARLRREAKKARKAARGAAHQPIVAQQQVTNHQAPPAPPAAAAAEKPWSSIAAFIGFLLGAGAVYSEAEPDWALTLFVGVVAAWIAGRFYRPLLVLAVVGFILWMAAGA